MVKEKFNEKATLLGRMGFQDPDLNDNLHDRIIAELYQNETQQIIVNKYIYPKIIEKEFRDIHLNPQNLKIIKNYQISLVHHTKCVEFPIHNNKYPIGFIDLYVSSKISHPYPKFNNSGSVRDDFNIYEGSTDIHLIFEVKSSHITLGELMRQLNMYQRYMKNSTLITPKSLYFYFVVVSQEVELG
ncbi:MAG: hypothetical protein ACFFAH_03640 [Promethearchaeota archaeon]